jgi:hypothetical protein
MPRCHVAPPSPDTRTMMSPELLMVNIGLAGGAPVPFPAPRMP